MIGHLGARVSALLDGQLPHAEAEDAWAHVYSCHTCRDLVEREGWIKSQLAVAARAGADDSTPDHLKGVLRDLTPGERFALDPRASAIALPGRAGGGRRTVAIVGSGAAGAAMLGVLAFGLVPVSTQTGDRRPPPSGVTVPVSTSTPSQAPSQAPSPASVVVSGSPGATAPAPSTRGPVGRPLRVIDQR